MVHHGAQSICACIVGADGLTPFRRLKGRKFGTPLAGFGERVWLRDPVLERANKVNPRCTEARLLGFCLTSSRHIVVDFDGRFRMVRTMCHQRIFSRPPIWSQRQLNSHAREELGEKVNPAAQRLERHPDDALPPDPDHDPFPRRLYLKQSDFMAHGTSDRCPGCGALVSGGRAQCHTEECRIRVEGEIRKTEEGKARLVLQPMMLPRGVHSREFGFRKTWTTTMLKCQSPHQNQHRQTFPLKPRHPALRPHPQPSLHYPRLKLRCLIK